MAQQSDRIAKVAPAESNVCGFVRSIGRIECGGFHQLSAAPMNTIGRSGMPINQVH
jgi:hypothetical protein